VRTLAIVAVLACPALAHADGASFDLGYIRSKVAVSDQTVLPATSVHFALRIDADNRIPHLHFGAEAEEGSLSGYTTGSGGAIARTDPATESGTSTPASTASPVDGNVLALKAFVGLHQYLGRIRLGADAAFGFRDAWVDSDYGMDVAGRKMEHLFELRSRVDYRLGHRLLVGATAGSDMIERRDVSVGVVLAIDCTR
jgi:hypothetical protein